jgi:hypothetical protein
LAAQRKNGLLRRFQDHRDPISELMNIDSNDVEVTTSHEVVIPANAGIQ